MLNWILVGLAGAMVGMAITEIIMYEKLRKRFDKLRLDYDKQFNRWAANLDKVDDKVRGVQADIRELNRLDDLENRIREIELDFYK